MINIDPTGHVLVDRKSRKILGRGYFPSGIQDPELEIVALTDEQKETLNSTRGTATITSDGSISITPPNALPPTPTQLVLTVFQQVQTTDADAHEIYRATLLPGSGYTGTATFVVIDNTTSTMQSVAARVAFRRLDSGAAVAGAPEFTSVVGDSMSQWSIADNVRADSDGNDVVVTVRGIAGHTMNWMISGTIMAYVPSA